MLNVELKPPFKILKQYFTPAVLKGVLKTHDPDILAVL